MTTATDVLNGSSSFQAAGFAKTVLLNQCGFDLGRAVTQAEKKDEPVFDARIGEALGDSGVPQAQVLDADELTRGVAASFILLVRHLGKADPETGRKPEYLRKQLKTPAEFLKAADDNRKEWALKTQMAQVRATAEMLGVNPTARIEAIKTEVAAIATTVTEPTMAYFVDRIKEYKDQDDDTLIDCAMEAMSNAGRDPSKEVKRAARAFLESQKMRLLDGKYVAVDAGIYALAQG